jgi:hypothetical protein
MCARTAEEGSYGIGRTGLWFNSNNQHERSQETLKKPGTFLEPSLSGKQRSRS